MGWDAENIESLMSWLSKFDMSTDQFDMLLVRYNRAVAIARDIRERYVRKDGVLKAHALVDRELLHSLRDAYAGYDESMAVTVFLAETVLGFPAAKLNAETHFPEYLSPPQKAHFLAAAEELLDRYHNQQAANPTQQLP
jgi:hypothetical protein